MYVVQRRFRTVTSLEKICHISAWSKDQSGKDSEAPAPRLEPVIRGGGAPGDSSRVINPGAPNYKALSKSLDYYYVFIMSPKSHRGPILATFQSVITFWQMSGRESIRPGNRLHRALLQTFPPGK